MTSQFVVASTNSPDLVAERHPQPLEMEAREQHEDEKAEHRLDQVAADLREHSVLLLASSLPSSVARRLAASTARAKRSASFSSSNTLSAASVVPPLEVTFLRRVAGDSLLEAASLAAPSTVCNASFRETSAGSPSFSADAASCSMNQNT